MPLLSTSPHRVFCSDSGSSTDAVPLRWHGVGVRRGPGLMTIDREALAHHEAGHAVVAKCFQVTIDRITIVANGDAAGHVIHSYGCNIDELKNALDNDAEEAPMRQWVLEREAIIALSGEIAQRRFRPDSVDEEGGGGDRLQVHQVLDLRWPTTSGLR